MATTKNKNNVHLYLHNLLYLLLLLFCFFKLTAIVVNKESKHSPALYTTTQVQINQDLKVKAIKQKQVWRKNINQQKIVLPLQIKYKTKKKRKKKMHFIFTTIITKQHICSSTTPSLGESTFFDQQLVLVLKIEPMSERGAALTEKLTVPLMIITFIIFRQKTL